MGCQVTQLGLTMAVPRPQVYDTIARSLSAKLQRAYAAIRSSSKTTLEWQLETGSCSAAKDAFYLRQAGIPVVCEYERKSARGARVFRWRLG